MTSVIHRLAALGAAAALAACAPAVTQGPPPGTPAPDPAAVEAALRAATTPSGPRQVNFAWELDESGARFRGRGVARFVAPERVRLDLFGPRGETLLAAALVDGEMRIPPIVAQRFRLPSPGLMWGMMGVVAPPAEARLLDATESDGATVLRYALGDDVLEYRARGARLESVRRTARGGVAESIDLTHDAGTLQRAQYRDWAAYRGLTLTLESSSDVASFPPDTWTPPGT